MNLYQLFVYLALGIGLRVITQQAPTPELSKNLWFALPAFGIFILFVLGISSWGAFIRQKLSYQFLSKTEEALFDLSVGTALAYVVSYFLTPFGLFSSSSGIFLWLVLSVGFSLGFSSLSLTKWFNFKQNFFGKLFMVLIPIIVIGKMIEGIQFHQHGDAYVTYLVGPRAWGESGSFEAFLRYSQLFLSTSWESLFAWGTALMGFRGGAGLDISQWFSQWASGGIGVFGTLLVCMTFCERLAKQYPLNSIWFPVIAISTAQVPVLRWTQNLAKNDMGIAFWGISAFYFSIYCAALSPSLAFFAGLLTGAAVVGKFTVLILGVLVSLYVIATAKKNSWFFILGGLVGSLPVLIRNYVLTQNPIFPWMPSLFHSSILNEFAENGASAAMKKSFLFSDVPSYYSEFFSQAPLYLTIFVLLLIPRFFKPTLKLVIIPFISFIIFTIALRPSTGIRYQNASLMLICLFSTYFMFFIIEYFGERYLKKATAFLTTAVLMVFSAGLLANSNLTLFTFFQIGNQKKFGTFSETLVNTNQIGGPAKVWIRSHIKPTEKILSFGDVHIYYLIDYPLTEIAQSVEYGKKVFHSTLDETMLLFKNAPFDYLYLAGEDYFKDAAYANDQMKILGIMGATEAWNPSCKRFDNTKAQVWDLKCLRSSN